MTAEHTYLGDGVYAAFESNRVVLTTEDGRSVTNTIILEPEVLHQLWWFVTHLKGKEA